MRELVVVLLLALAPAAEIGRPATPAEIAARDITVLPTGVGLPPGRGSAPAGRDLYAARCAACHGLRGEGQGEAPPLAGGQGSLTSREPKPTVGSYWPYATTVWDYIRRAMPYDHPGSLTPDEVYAITAYVLSLNGIVADDAILDAASLPAVRMPNRDGFVDDPRPDILP